MLGTNTVIVFGHSTRDASADKTLAASSGTRSPRQQRGQQVGGGHLRALCTLRPSVAPPTSKIIRTLKRPYVAFRAVATLIARQKGHRILLG